MKRSLLLLVSALVLAACPAMAKTYYVGTCRTGSFASISEAVKSVPEGSIVDICPGIYYEQVIISKSLTLQAITANNRDFVEICCSAEKTAESQVLGLDLVPAIWVTAGTVNISNIDAIPPIATYDCPWYSTGIFYGSGASGTVNHVVVNAQTKGCGVGIAAENNTGNDSSVTIENSYIVSDNFGILMGSQQPDGTNPVLLNTITGNTIESGLHGMLLFLSRGKVSANNLTVSTYNSSTYGILEAAPATAITNNAISGPWTGISIDVAATTVTGNRIFNVYTGIDLGCSLGNISNNTIFGGGGLDHVPANFTGKNTFITQTNVIGSSGC
jgi:hypothetical protein